jgi:hypothetical protein
MHTNVTQGTITEKQRDMLRDPRQQCLYVSGRRRGVGLYQRMLNETMGTRHAIIHKVQRPTEE